MTRLAVGLFAFVVLGMQGGAQGKDPTIQNTCRQITVAEVIATQDRVNTYFHRGVVPKLLSCWSSIPGRGSVAATFVFSRKGDLWMPGDISLTSSTAGDGQQALSCLRAAVAGTAFPVAAADGENTLFTLNWSFPVPWPRDMNEAAARFIVNGGRSKCGGTEGPQPACQWCEWNSAFSFSYCASACVGFVGCVVENQWGCKMPGGQCATGSVFGNIGGVVAY